MTTTPAWPVLDANERRVLGVLIEKAKTTPDAYPMSINALMTGCNQKSNREPVMSLTDLDVEDTLARLQADGATFEVGTSNPADVGQVTWLRLSSTTHAFNGSQRINFLKFSATATSVTVTAPASPNVCPPGYYMLFVLSRANVPSIAKIVRIN